MSTAIWTRFGAGLLAAVVAGGCSTADRRADVAPPPEARTETPCLMTAEYSSPQEQLQNYKIQSGDDLAISFYLNSEFDTDAPVRPDGKVSLRLVGEQQARGLTAAQLSAELDQAYANELLNPGVSVLVKSTPGRVVYVQGQVDHPGAIPLQPEMTALGAIAQAGGLSEGAAPNHVVMIRRDMCGQPHAQELRLSGALKGKSDMAMEEDAQLLPGDLLVVPRSQIANVGLAVKQYVKDLIPVQPYFVIP